MMAQKVCIVLLLICLTNNCEGVWDTPEPVDVKGFVYVKTSGGELQGLDVESKPGQRAYVFKRVPYAEAPLGQLRFRNLSTRRSWHGVWNSTYYSPACPSKTTATTSPQAIIAEDCIYANIFADPKCFDGKKKCPVLFYVHGGNFYYDSAVMFNDRQIVAKYASDGVVFVIPAFRIGIFGVLDVDDENIVPKNLGLNDIIFALKWTSKEISHFGGDAKRITIMGNSGGGEIVELLLSHHDIPEDLFRQAIVSSALTSIDKNSARPLTQAILSRFNCSGPIEITEQVECLRHINASELLEAQRYLVDERGVQHGGVVTSRDLPAENYPELLRYLKPRTVWFATTSDEMHAEREPAPDESCRSATSAFGYMTLSAHEACIDRYLWPLQSGQRTKENLIVPGTEAIHAQSLLVALVNAHKGGESYRSTFRLANHSHHADDLLFFFGLHWKNVTYNAAERLMDAYYPQVVKNFLRNGVLAKEWKPIRDDGRGFYVFDFEISANNESENANSSHFQLQKWPRFEKGYDDPDGEQFWLVEAAKLEASALGYEFAPFDISKSSESEELQHKFSRKWNDQGHARRSYSDSDENGSAAHEGHYTWTTDQPKATIKVEVITPPATKQNLAENSKKFESSTYSYNNVYTTESGINEPKKHSKIARWWKNPWWRYSPWAREQRKNRTRHFLEDAKDANDLRKNVSRAQFASNEKSKYKEQAKLAKKAFQAGKEVEKKQGQLKKELIQAAENEREEAEEEAKEEQNERKQEAQKKRDEFKEALQTAENARKETEKKAKEKRDELKKTALEDAEKKRNELEKESEKQAEEKRGKLEEKAFKAGQQAEKKRRKFEKKSETWEKKKENNLQKSTDINDEGFESDESKISEGEALPKPYISPSRTSLEWSKHFNSSLKGIKDIVRHKLKDSGPLISASSTSIEAQNQFKHDVKNVKGYLREKKRYGEPLVEASDKSVKHYKKFIRKQKHDEPLIKPSRKSIEWARAHKSKSPKDSEKWDQDRSQKNIRRNFHFSGKDKKNGNNYRIYDFKYSGLVCVYDASSNSGQTTPRLNCTHYEIPDRGAHRPRSSQSSPVGSWNRPLNSTEVANDTEHQQNANDISVHSAEVNENGENGEANPNSRNSTKASSHRRNGNNETCPFWCFPNPWWRKNDHRVRSGDKRQINHHGKLSENLKNHNKEPPFWLPFLNVNLVLANDEDWSEFNGNINGGELSASVMADLNEMEEDWNKLPNPETYADLSYFDKLQRQQSAPRSDITAVEYQHADAQAEYRVPALWLSVCVLLLVISVVLIIVASRMLFRFKSARGYSYNPSGEEFFTEKSRFVTARNGYNSPKYTT